MDIRREELEICLVEDVYFCCTGMEFRRYLTPFKLLSNLDDPSLMMTRVKKQNLSYLILIS